MSERPIKPWIERLWRVFGDNTPGNLGAYIPARRSIRVEDKNESLFGETLITERKTVISINSAFGISGLRQNTVFTGSGSADATQKGKIVLSTGTTAGSLAQLRSAEVGQYAPGFGAEIGLGVRLTSTLAGTAFARWGGLSSDGENGFYFREEAGGVIKAVRRKAGVEVDAVPRTEWELDRLDGSGGPKNPSGINIGANPGLIWQVDFSWYGYGVIVFGIVRGDPVQPEAQHFIPCHYLQAVNDISIEEPNLQLFVDVDNGDQTTDYQINIGGMQYAVVGDNEGARKRSVDDYVTEVASVGTTPKHLISFQRKSAFLNRSVAVDSLELAIATEPMLFEVWVGGTVTGGTYDTPQNYEATETSVESVRDQTFSTTDAILIYRTYVAPGAANKPGDDAEPLLDFDLPDGKVITLTARTLQNTGTVSFALMRLKEGW